MSEVGFRISVDDISRVLFTRFTPLQNVFVVVQFVEFEKCLTLRSGGWLLVCGFP